MALHSTGRPRYFSEAGDVSISLYTVPGEARDQTLKGMADLVGRLLGKDCALENSASMREEGVRDLRAAYGILVGLATRELTAAPEIGLSLVDFERYLNFQKIDEHATKQ